MSGVVNIHYSSLDSDSDDDPRNNMSASEIDGTDDIERLRQERERKKLKL